MICNLFASCNTIWSTYTMEIVLQLRISGIRPSLIHMPAESANLLGNINHQALWVLDFKKLTHLLPHLSSLPSLLTQDSRVSWKILFLPWVPLKKSQETKTFGMLLLLISQLYNTLSPLISESIADYERRCICTGLSPSGMQVVGRVILPVRDFVKTETEVATMELVRGT